MGSLPFCSLHLKGQRPGDPRGTADKPLTLGKWLWARRTALGLHQLEVAARLRVTLDAVQRWERDRHKPSVPRLAELRLLFGEPPEALLSIHKPHPRPSRVLGRPASTYPKELRSIGDHIRSRRLDLGLIQTEVAKRLGVTAFTVTNWERNHTIPATRLVPRLVEFLGYVPFESGETLPQRIRAYRFFHGLSQTQLAELIKVDPSTVWRWEAGNNPAPTLVPRLEKLLCSSSATAVRPRF
jgi:transcriptional regulator with XRE-family HTH domain